MRTLGPGATKTLRIVGIVALFFFSFSFFLYLTFPYEVLKESLAAELSAGSSFNIQIGELGPKIPLGIVAKDVQVSPQSGGKALKIARVDVSVSMFWLMLGKISTNLTLSTNDKGVLDLGLDIGLFQLLGKSPMPSLISMDSNQYPIDDLVGFGLGAYASSPAINPMLPPLITALGFTGKLNAAVKLRLNQSEPSQSTGSAEITLVNGILKLSDPALGLTDQKFSAATIKAALKDGTLAFDPKSGFIAEELALTINGKVAFKSSLQQSGLDLNIGIKLDKDLRDKFGFVIDMVGGGQPKNGELTVKLRGSVAQPAVETI